jgi:hypothetical protein
LKVRLPLAVLVLQVRPMLRNVDRWLVRQSVVVAVRQLLVVRLPEVEVLRMLPGEAADLRCRHQHRLLPEARLLLLRILRVLRMPRLEEAA